MMENHKEPENKAIYKNLSESIEEPHPHASTSPGIKHLPSELQEKYKKIKEHVHERERLENLKLAVNFDTNQSNNPFTMSKNHHFPFPNNVWLLNPEPVKNDKETLEKKTIFEANDEPVQRPCVTEPRKSWHSVLGDVSNTTDPADKELSELRKLKMNIARLKKAVKLAKSNHLKKKSSIIPSKKALERKERKLLYRAKLSYPNLDKPDTENLHSVIDDVSNTIDQAEKELSELRKMKMNVARLKKAVKLAESNRLKKKRSIILLKKALGRKSPDTGDSQNLRSVFDDVSNTIDQAEKELSELRKLKMNVAGLKKAVKLVKSNRLKKKRSIILLKKALGRKERNLLYRVKLSYPNLDKPDTGDSQKGCNECDLAMMRFNEVRLRSSEVRSNVSKVLQPAGVIAVKKLVKAKKLIEALMSKPSHINSSGTSSVTNQ